MKDYLEDMYKAFQESDIEKFDDIVDDIRDNNIKLSLEDIVPLCRLNIMDSEEIEYSQILEIARITFWAIERNDMEKGLQELIIGLEEIYNKGQKDTWTNWYGETCEGFINRYISMAILRYKEEDMVLFGKLISKNTSIKFKSALLKILELIMINEDDIEEYLIKGKILKENIK